MRKGRVPEAFGRLTVENEGWQRYTHLENGERQAFQRLYKSPRAAFLLAFFLGAIGAQRFYLGHWRVGSAIAGIGIASLFITPLWWVAVAIYLIELGHIVRTTEQWNDSLEGALMLGTYSKPLFTEKE